MGRFFSSGVFRPLRFVGRSFFRGLALPVYRLYLGAARRFERIFRPAKNPILFPLTHRYVLHTLLALLVLLVVFDSVNAKATKAEVGLEPDSAIAELAPPAEESSEEVVEGPIHRTIPGANFGVPSVSPEQGLRFEGVAAGEEDALALAPNLAVSAEGLAASEGLRQSIEEYTVEGGDTVSTIARKFGVSTNTILWANGLDDSSLIKPGQKLVILPLSGVKHEVKSGETLENIVNKYRGQLAPTVEFNRLADASDVHVGDTIVVPGGEIPEPVAPRVQAPAGRGFEPFNVPPPSREAGGNFLWPTTGRRIFQYFRFRHTGIDIDGDYSSPIYAARDGVVEYVSYQRYGYGYHVIVNHGGGVKTLYSHASKIFVQRGQTVKRGQTIAIVGSTGRSTGTHLHFEIIINGRKVNPLGYY